jgi:hypothetical protein
MKTGGLGEPAAVHNRGRRSRAGVGAAAVAIAIMLVFMMLRTDTTQRRLGDRVSGNAASEGGYPRRQQTSETAAAARRSGGGAGEGSAASHPSETVPTPSAVGNRATTDATNRATTDATNAEVATSSSFALSSSSVASGAYPPVLWESFAVARTHTQTARWCPTSNASAADGDCRRIARPAAAFEMHRQSEYAPEILLVAKRRVTRLFVLQPAWRDGSRNLRAAETVAFALWLLTAVDTDGAAVLTARSEGDYGALVRGLKEAEGAGYDASAVGNVFVSPVTFVPPAAAEGDHHTALLWHLAGLDAAEERFAPERVVLFDSVPVAVPSSVAAGNRGAVPTRRNAALPRQHITELRARCSPPAPEVGVNVTAVAGVEAADGTALLQQLRRTGWRFWFVDGRWALQQPSGAGATVPPPRTVEQLLRARLHKGGDASPPPVDVAAAATVALAPFSLDRALKDCHGRVHRPLRPHEAAIQHRRNRFVGQRRYDGVVVQVAGEDDVVTVDNAMAVLVRNPSWLVVVVAPTQTGAASTWFERTPAHLRANLRVYSTAAAAETAEARAPCVGLQERSPETVDAAAEATCIGAMLSRVVAPTMSGGGGGGGVAAKHRVVDAPVAVLMPVRHAVVFGGNLTEAFASIASNQRARAAALPSAENAAIIAVNLDRAYSWSVELALHQHDGNVDAASLERLGSRLVADLPGAAANNDTSDSSSGPRRSLIFDIRRQGARSPSAAAFPEHAERPEAPWPASDVHRALSEATVTDGAVIAHPVGVGRGVGNGPWRYQIRRMRLDPVSVVAMDPLYKANLWCDADTLEGCPARMIAAFLETESCKRRNEELPHWLPIKCPAVATAGGGSAAAMDFDDHRIQEVDRRPPPALATSTARTPPSVANASRGDEAERFFFADPAQKSSATRTKVDVLISVISQGNEDMVDMAESWLEYCPTCVLAVECGYRGDPGRAYDTLRAGLAPEVFARTIVNPKRGIYEAELASVVVRHMHNLRYALCFVNPLRVQMVASNEGVFRRGLAEYLLSRSATQVLDHYSLVAEADEEHPHWTDQWTLGVAPRVTQAAQSLVYGNTVAPLWWKRPSLFFCTGKALYDQVKTGATSAVGFEGTWYTGRQFARVAAGLRLGFWLDPTIYKEHLLLHPTLLKDELLRLYPTPWRTPESSSPPPPPSKPPGRNTCFLAKLRVPGPLTLEEVTRAVDAETGGQPFQFSLKRIGAAPWDPARVFLRQRRKAAMGIPDARPPQDAPPPAPTRSAPAAAGVRQRLETRKTPAAAIGEGSHNASRPKPQHPRNADAERAIVEAARAALGHQPRQGVSDAGGTWRGRRHPDDAGAPPSLDGGAEPPSDPATTVRGVVAPRHRGAAQPPLQEDADIAANQDWDSRYSPGRRGA